jgi:hypothetical protein
MSQFAKLLPLLEDFTHTTLEIVTRASISGSFCQSGASRSGSFCQTEPLVGMLGFVLPNRATVQHPSTWSNWVRSAKMACRAQVRSAKMSRSSACLGSKQRDRAVSIDLVELGSFGQNGMPRSGSFSQNGRRGRFVLPNPRAGFKPAPITSAASPICALLGIQNPHCANNRSHQTPDRRAMPHDEAWPRDPRINNVLGSF